MSENIAFHSAVEIHGRRILLAAGSGPVLGSEANALELIGEALGAGADLIAIPAARMAPAFFSLKTGLAGAMLQKITNYRLGLAVVGEIPADALQSQPLRDFIAESNRRGQVLFVADMAELEARLAPR